MSAPPGRAADPATARTPAPAIVARSRWLALAVITTATLMTILDGSIVTVAMPSIQDDLRLSPAGLSWVVNAYLIAFGSLLLLAGRLGDLVGRTRVFLAGIALFTVASLLAGAARTPAVLVGARFLQGVGSAMAVAVSLGILVTLFTEPGTRARAIAVYSFTGAAGASIGQVAGGVLTDALSWHWIFLINLPIGLVALATGVAVLPRERGTGLAGGADVAGALLVTGGLVLGSYAVVSTAGRGFGSPATLGAGLLSAVLLAGFVARQATARRPLLPLRILRSRTTSGANLVQVLVLAAMFAFQVLIALDLQQVQGYGATATGLAMLPAAVGIGAVSLGASARLISRYGERAVLLAGLTLLTAMLALLTRLPVRADYATELLPAMLLVAGGGLVLPALTSLAMSGAGPDDAGLASGLFNTTQQVGMAAGVAVLSTLAASRTGGLLAGGASRAEALTGGYRIAFGTGAALMLAAVAVTATVLRRPSTGAVQAYRERRSGERPSGDTIRSMVDASSGTGGPGRNAAPGSGHSGPSGTASATDSPAAGTSSSSTGSCPSVRATSRACST